jgi:hypothetical protein
MVYPPPWKYSTIRFESESGAVTHSAATPRATTGLNVMSAAGTKEEANFSQPARISSMAFSPEILAVRSVETSL